MRQTARNVKGLTPGRGKAMFLGGVETRKAARRLGAGAVEGRRVRVGVSNKKRAGTRLRSGPSLAMATFSAYTQPGPPSKDDGGRTADGEAEHAAWKTSDDYRKKVFMSFYVSFWEKKQIISASHPFGVIPGCR